MRKYKTVKGVLNSLLKLWSDPKHWTKGRMGSDDSNGTPFHIVAGGDLPPLVDPKNCSFCFVGGLRLLSDNLNVNERVSCLIANNAFSELNKRDGKAENLAQAEDRIINWNDEATTTLPQLRRKLSSVIRKLEKDPSLGKL